MANLSDLRKGLGFDFPGSSSSLLGPSAHKKGEKGISSAAGIGSPPGRFALGAIQEILKSGPQLPLLKSVQPPARRRRRSTDPFDFFGTLFNPPTATQGLSNPTSLLNQTV